MRGKKRKEWIAACAVILAGNLLGLGIFLREKSELSVEKLERNVYGEGSYEENLKVRTENGTEEIQILVEEQEYTAGEVRKYLKQAEKELEKWLGEQTDAKGRIQKNLDFPQEFPDNPTMLSWSTKDPEILEWDGTLGEGLTEKGGQTELRCRLSLGEEEQLWKKEVQVYPADMPEAMLLQQEIQTQADQENSPFSKELFLPQIVDGKKVRYEKEEQGTGLTVCLLSVVLGLGIFPLEREKEKQKREKIRRQMETDYPDLLEKLSLLLRAGFSVRKAVEKLAADYRKEKERYQLPRRYAYEELTQVCREMEGGIYEAEAYDRMGKRCEALEYKTLAMILVQNLKKGNQNILELLEREAISAGEERKRRAKIRGEEASTKLLLPMILQLMVVLVILVVPAFMAFL